MSTTVEKLRGLVEALYNNTTDNKIDWNITGDKQNVWSNIDGYRVELSEEPSGDFQNDIRVTVFNDSGDQIDTFSDIYFRGLIPKTVNSSGYYAVMSTLLESARRQASGADVAIEKILNSLGGTPIKDARVTFDSSDDIEDDVPF